MLGNVYRFVYVAVNSYGDSIKSLPLVSGVGQPPQVTLAPIRDTSFDHYDTASGKVAMLIKWEGHTITADLPVLGFILEADDGLANDD